jgi:hypothetical protein
MRDPLFLIGSVLVVVSALLALACVVSQALLARWWETPAGRHVFIFQGVLAAVLALWALRIWVPDNAFVLALRFAAFAGVPVVLGWRLLIILKTWRAKRREHIKERQ